ncbi:MAG: RNA methyltransferase [Ignavibacteria bacterium]|jgi:tRNA G18 (ribose-2'-O)-methylase SpoU|nr:RNA methyltransferase [Ignavibacteria bacterium]MCU7499817.1 RNA methyltransferase [Ignavibacteria bacterium]MCU7513290.1 RNA methyltransferase [Ignavibacteria bacterium]MCU7522147.1 RNA methyltransferase [Ignavibacteria bacterium]MCU7525752.1 RNA methyltransferase [Ignavibacteria bacterium]
MKKLTHDEISVNRSTLDTLHTVNKLPVYVLLDNIRSTYNVGSIFRTSDGAMIEKLFLCGYTPHPPKKEILKTALGSTESVKWEYVKDPKEAVLALKSQGVKICALEQTSKSRTYYSVPESEFPLCLIVGNEITGVSQDLIDLCDFSVEIPQFGIKQSLNVAVAYGIAIFDLRRIYDVGCAGEAEVNK